MKLSVLMTWISISTLQNIDVMAKSSSAMVNQDGKTRYSQKINSVSTTIKPELPNYSSGPQYHNIQAEKQSHFTQNLPAIPQQLQQQQQQQQLNYQQYQQPLVHQIPIQTAGPVNNQLDLQSQQQILQLIQKVLYNTQQSNQPTAMIIIAQPIYPSATNVPYGNTAQQLLNYYHSNPQARYQFLHGSPQPQPITQYASPLHNQAVQASQQVTSYPVLPSPLQYQTKILPIQPVTHLSPVEPSEAYHQHHQQQQQQQQQPLQLAQIAQYATEYAAQQNYRPQTEPQVQFEPESRQNDVEYSQSLPPIITGLENFSPEHQEKIKAQLSAHFGGPLQPLPAKQNKDIAKFQGLNTNEFVPNYGVKKGRSDSNIMSINKNRYTKM